jgi:hypothetical protein
MELVQAKVAFRYVDWTVLARAEDGTMFAVVVDGEPVVATKAQSNTKGDSDYDRNISVVVTIAGQAFRQNGYLNVGSACYEDEYETSWNGTFEEVFPHEKTVTVYETAK